MGNSCCTPADQEKGQVRVDEGEADSPVPVTQEVEAPAPTEIKEEPAKPEEEPAQEPIETVPTPRGFNPKGVGFIFKVEEPEKLVFRESKKAEVVDPQTDPQTILKAWYGDPSEEWSEEKGINVLDKVRSFLSEGKEVKADNELFGDPAPNVRKVLLLERKFTIKPIDMTIKPLGMTFRDKTPIVITKLVPDGGAEKNGVQVGWELVKIGDDDLAGKSYKDCFALIQAAINKL